jgi:hypothetical protein
MERLLLILLGALILLALASGVRRRTRTYSQTWLLPVFTDSMPHDAYEQARLATLIADARLLLHRGYGGAATSRRAMTAKRMNTQRMSDRRWQAAVRLLRSLGIYAPHGTTPVISEYHALRKIERWHRVQAARASVSPRYVAGH